MGGCDKIKLYRTIQEIRDGIHDNRKSDQENTEIQTCHKERIVLRSVLRACASGTGSRPLCSGCADAGYTLQRLGQSPDKFEMVLGSSLFNMVRLRDLISEAVYRRKRNLAELLLRSYPSRTQVDEMYRCRMNAFLVYHMDKDCALAAKHLQKSIALTLPDYSYEHFYEQMENHLISAVELENLLALERMNIERNTGDSHTREISKRHLELCLDYIEKHFRGDEEYAKLLSKCAWLVGGICYLKKTMYRSWYSAKKESTNCGKTRSSILCCLC